MKGGSNEMLRTPQAAEYLNVGISWLYHNWRSEGMKPYKVGGTLRFRVRDLENWLEKRRAA